MINFLAVDCSTISSVISFIKNGIIPIIQLGVPIVIIVLGSIDLFKAVIASKEDEIKAAQKMLIKRIIYGVIIFFLVTIVTLVFNTLAGNSGNDAAGANNWLSCWNQA